MRQRLRAYASLVRAFLTPTALADSSAGFLAAASFGDVETLPLGRWAAAGAASIALYWFGMAANDLFDHQKDQSAAVPRPLVTGAVRVSEVVALLFALAATALALGSSIGALGPVAAVLLLALTYDAGGKRIPLFGNLLMGGCRGGNLLLGAAAAVGTKTAFAWPELLAMAALLVIYIASVTAVSVLEDRDYSPRTLTLAATPCLAFPLLFVSLQPSDPWVWANALTLAVLIVHGLRRALASSRAGAPRQGAAIFVQTGLGAIFFVDFGLVLALVPRSDYRQLAALVLVGLFVSFQLWKRYWVRAASG